MLQGLLELLVQLDLQVQQELQGFLDQWEPQEHLDQLGRPVQLGLLGSQDQVVQQVLLVQRVIVVLQVPLVLQALLAS